MSPESTRGESELDGRSDIYSLGATVYATLTGRPPFEGQSITEVIGKIRDEEPVPPPAISGRSRTSLSALCCACSPSVPKTGTKRPATCSETWSAWAAARA